MVNLKKAVHIIFLLIFSSLTIESLQASTCPTDRADYFCRSIDAYPHSQVTEQHFFITPIKIYSLFQTQILSLPSPLIFDLQWKSPFFGAGISHYENQFRLMILGGTTRIDHFSSDAFAALICHELGHLIGGGPYQTIPGAQWASAEGQADFFAASVCLPKYYQSLGASLENIPALVEKAGFDLINSFLFLEKEPLELPQRYLKNSQAVSTTLLNQYPSLACRYETFLFPQKRQECWFVE